MLNFINNCWNTIQITFTKFFNIIKEPMIYTILFSCILGFLISILTMNILLIMAFMFLLLLCVELIERM